MSNYPIFSVVGIEIEYMLVNNELEIQSKSDKVLEALAGTLTDEVPMGDISVGNELVLHVLELKNNGPKPFTEAIATSFHEAVMRLQPILHSLGLKFLPTGAHPWMDPIVETKRWPHGYNEIYQQYDTIFDCKGHGWSNLQSMHVNFPFANDEEFFQLHNTIRILLPLLPALAASTPILDGKRTGLLDSRLSFYETNQKKIPAISGQVIPEFIRSREEYETLILNPMYQAIKPYDAGGLLQFEWLNSRAAIPKFERNAIEIRILDSQECVHADIAIAEVCHFLMKHWLQQSDFHLTHAYPTEKLKQIYDEVIRVGFDATVEDTALLAQWQLPKRTMNLQEVWSLLLEQIAPMLSQNSQRALEYILREGNLSERILRSLPEQFSKDHLKNIYARIENCLVNNQQLAIS